MCVCNIIEELEALKTYVANGGSVLILGGEGGETSRCVCCRSICMTSLHSTNMKHSMIVAPT